MVGAEITTKDEPILNALTAVTFTTTFHPQKEEETFQVTFTFAPNDYFTNTVLTKTIVVDTEEQRPVESTGTPIQWKEGKNVTVKTVQKKQKNKKTN